MSSEGRYSENDAIGLELCRAVLAPQSQNNLDSVVSEKLRELLWHPNLPIRIRHALFDQFPDLVETQTK